MGKQFDKKKIIILAGLILLGLSFTLFYVINKTERRNPGLIEIEQNGIAKTRYSVNTGNSASRSLEYGDSETLFLKGLEYENDMEVRESNANNEPSGANLFQSASSSGGAVNSSASGTGAQGGAPNANNTGAGTAGTANAVGSNSSGTGAQGGASNANNTGAAGTAGTANAVGSNSSGTGAQGGAPNANNTGVAGTAGTANAVGSNSSGTGVQGGAPNANNTGVAGTAGTANAAGSNSSGTGAQGGASNANNAASSVSSNVQNIPPPPPHPPERMELLGGGSFYMGSPVAEEDRDENEVQHYVTVKPFYIGMYQVTQLEYQEIMGKNPSYFRGPNLPVETVSWFDAIDYCNHLSLKHHLTPAYRIVGSMNNRAIYWDKDANGYRLPTEEEWEYACRAGTTTPFNTGRNISRSRANYFGRGTVNVGIYPPNAWGLYDMHGNVAEWCWNKYQGYGYTPPESQMESMDHRVLRGGSWLTMTMRMRSAFRDHADPLHKSQGIGFRIVRNE